MIRGRPGQWREAPRSPPKEFNHLPALFGVWTQGIRFANRSGWSRSGLIRKSSWPRALGDCSQAVSPFAVQADLTLGDVARHLKGNCNLRPVVLLGSCWPYSLSVGRSSSVCRGTPHRTGEPDSLWLTKAAGSPPPRLSRACRFVWFQTGCLLQVTAAANLRFPTLAVVGWIGLPKCT